MKNKKCKIIVSVIMGFAMAFIMLQILLSIFALPFAILDKMAGNGNFYRFLNDEYYCLTVEDFTGLYKDTVKRCAGDQDGSLHVIDVSEDEDEDKAM